MLVTATDRHRLHDPLIQVEAGHRDEMQESPARAEQIRDALEADGRYELVEPPDAGLAPIDAVHDPAMVRYLADAHAEWSAATGLEPAIPDVFLHPGLRDGMGPLAAVASPLGRLGYWCFETTTPIVAGTYAAARGAVDCAIAATDAVLTGAASAYALCRPPGHHAATAVFGGYCFFNNAAIAAQHARESGAARVAVLDVDYHHGNGTQQIFWSRPDVFYGSLHGDPARAYPYFVGFADEVGGGAGRGTNLNVPLPASCDDVRYRSELGRVLDAIAAFDAEVLVVSLGLDLFDGDPLGDLAVTSDGIAAIGRDIAARGLPTVVVQEGGYAVDRLGANAAAFLDAFAGGASGPPR
jgi:acetoin utilization deacetylase AcuC-like enzyme